VNKVETNFEVVFYSVHELFYLFVLDTTQIQVVREKFRGLCWNCWTS